MLFTIEAIEPPSNQKAFVQAYYRDIHHYVVASWVEASPGQDLAAASPCSIALCLQAGAH